MPPDEAPHVDWFKSIFRQMNDIVDQNEDLREALQFSQNELKDCKSNMEDMSGDITKLESQINYLECQNKDLHIELESLKENHLKTEIHLREQHLVFEGIRETYGENPGMLHHKIVVVLNHLRVFQNNADKIQISKIQRVGPFFKDHCRPIVCHFMRYCDAQIVLRNSSQMPRDVFVREDLPPVIGNRRRILRPIFIKAKKMDAYKGKCRLMYDKLIISGKAFTVEPLNNLHELPFELNPRNSAEKQNEEAIVFFTQGSPLSNFHHAPFMKDNIGYSCSEQYIQAKKAELFNDDLAHSKIMLTTDPYAIKKLGSRVRNFVKPRWEREAKKIAQDACMAKFSQNERLREVLLETNGKRIGEGSKDVIWGIGMSLDNENVLNTNLWHRGQNLLGEILTYVREQLQD